MGKMKKVLAAGVVCYVAYKLGKKYLKENNMTAEEVFDSVKKKAEEYAKQAAGSVPTTKDGEPAGKKIYTFGLSFAEVYAIGNVFGASIFSAHAI